MKKNNLGLLKTKNRKYKLGQVSVSTFSLPGGAVCTFVYHQLRH